MRAGRFLISTAAAAALGFAVATAMAASSDYLLTISGIDGESRGHPETIEVASWSLGASNPTSVGSSGMGAGKVQVNDFTIMKSVDKASPILAKACASGAHFKKVTLSMRAAGHGPRQTTSYYDAVCTALSPSSGGEDHPMESVTFHYARMEGPPPPASSSATVGAAPAGVARPH
jgi:type VI secretion system secreted protein Hcp